MKQLTREWLNAAGDDLITIENLLNNPILTNIVAFHSQQVIEKTLKGFPKTKHIIYRWVTLTELFLQYLLHPRLKPGVIHRQLLQSFSFSVNELVISELDRLYIDARYPGDLGLMPYGKPTLEEAKIYYLEALMIKEQTEAFLIK
jgi:HEPN domain-containing protein